MYRITRTMIRGQFANDSCFATWLNSQGSAARLVKTVEDPLNNDGPNDKRLWLWEQRAVVTTPKCPNSDPDLITHAGSNGWPTEAEAQAVLDLDLAQSQALVNEVTKAMVSGFATGVGEDVAAAADKAAEVAKDAAKAVSSGGPWIVVGLVALAALAWKVLK